MAEGVACRKLLACFLHVRNRIVSMFSAVGFDSPFREPSVEGDEEGKKIFG